MLKTNDINNDACVEYIIIKESWLLNIQGFQYAYFPELFNEDKEKTQNKFINMLYLLKANSEEKKVDPEDSNLLNTCSFFKVYDNNFTDDEEANIKLEEEVPSDDEK